MAAAAAFRTYSVGGST